MKPENINPSYKPNTIGSLMSPKVPTCNKSDDFESIIKNLTEKPWEDINYVFVLDSDKKLVGVIDIARVVQEYRSIKAESLMQEAKVKLHPQDDQEKAVFSSVKYDLDIIPVVDSENYFLGAVVSKTIIDVMHTEHLEDTLLSSGIHGKGSHITKLATAGLNETIKARAPWLIVGMVAGLGLGFIASIFEKELQKTIALAYFVPVVAYIADSVGTQSEAIAIRALATLKINYFGYLLREFFVGLILGSIVGTLGALGSLIVAHSAHISVIVGISLFMASAIASVMASIIPIIFKLLGKDPALGSGPLATAIQDVLSVLIYFIVATILL